MRRFWLAAVGSLVLVLSARPVLGAGDAVLVADPPGAHLSVNGTVSLSGVASLPIAGLPAGEYELEAGGPGLPAVRGRFALSPTGVSPRPWVGPVAIIMPPGLVHLEHGEARGWTLAGTGIAGATMAIVGQSEVRNAQQKIDRAQRAYDWAISEESIADARWSLLAARQERDDREEIRNLWLGYLGAVWVGSSIEALLLTPQPAIGTMRPGEYVARLPRASGGKAALRSAIFPGSGQRYMGRSLRANFFFTATAALAAASIAAQDVFLEARRDQAQALRRFNEVENEAELDWARRDLERAAERVNDKDVLRWALVGATAGVYVWNVLDAFGIGQDARIPGLTWTVTPGSLGSDGVLLCATWSMP